MNIYETGVNNSLRQEVALQQNRLFKLACKLIVLAGAGLFVEGVLSNGPADSLAGVAAAGVAAIVYFSPRGKILHNARNS